MTPFTSILVASNFSIIRSWIDLTLDQTQRCHHLAWFLYGCLEREHVLNLDACAAWWVRGGRVLSKPAAALIVLQ